MKTTKFLICSAILAVWINCFAIQSLGQNDIAQDLKPNSSLTEILNWLNQYVFPKARISLYEPARSSDDGLYHSPAKSIAFSSGFRLLKTEKECETMLRNEQAVILFGKFGIDTNNKEYSIALSDFIDNAIRTQQPVVAEVGVNLRRMSYKRGDPPYSLSNSDEKLKLLGKWATRYRENSRLSAVGSFMYYRDETKQDRKIHLVTDDVTFSFDDEETAQKFDKAYRQAIQICRKQ
jgi:hypothetical protein